MKKIYLFLIFAFVLQLSTRVEAVSLELSCNISGVTCDNSGVYTLKGVDFVNVNGVQVVIQYDATTLKNPSATKGALLPATGFINPNNTSSSIIVTGTSTIPSNGNGVLATLKFTTTGTTVGDVSIQSSKLTSLPSGALISHSIKNPADFAAEAAAQAAAAAKLAALKAAQDAEAARLAAEKTAQDAEAARLAELKTAQDAEAARLAIKDAEDKQLAALAAEKAAKEAEAARLEALKTAQAAAAAQATANAAATAQVAADTKAVTTAQAVIQTQANAAGISVVGTSVGSTSVGGASIGTITLPVDLLASSDRKTEYQPLVTDLRGDMTIPTAVATAAPTTATQGFGKEKQQENRSVSYKSVLQLFKEYQGEKSAKEMIALFAEGAIPNFTQDPPVALSDGITTVKLTLKLKVSGNETPKFLLQGASVKQMSSEGEEQDVWIIDALPKKGVYDAKLTVIDGQNIMEFPLVVAPTIGPVVPKALKFTEADFIQYLSKSAKFDLNKDEKFDSIDDYIYTANYIAALKIKPEKLKKEEPKPAQKNDVKAK